MAMTVTINEIARKLNLSVGTVSKALNNYRDVSDTTRARVRAAARELGYSPSASARNLRRRRTERIGVVVTYSINIVNDFLSEFIPGAVAAAEDSGYSLTLFTHAAQDPEQLSKICQTREVDGLLLLWPPDVAATVRLLQAERMPYVIAPRRVSLPDASYVAADHYQGGWLLTRHLLEFGHSRIAFASRPDLFETNQDRLAGYCEALKHAGLSFDPNLVVPIPGNRPDAGEVALNALLEMDGPPTALLCFTDAMAIQVLSLASERQIAIPDQLSVAGHDGILLSGLTVPPLTTVRQPIAQIGRLAIESLLARLEDADHAPHQTMLPVELIARQSTGLCSAQPFQIFRR